MSLAASEVWEGAWHAKSQCAEGKAKEPGIQCHTSSTVQLPGVGGGGCLCTPHRQSEFLIY